MYQGKKCVGYRLRNKENGDEEICSKEKTWELAKQKLIYCVEAKGTPDKPSIAGKFGYELKKLPSEQMVEQAPRRMGRYIR